MSMYLSNSGLRPTGAELVEFIDAPPMAEEVLPPPRAVNAQPASDPSQVVPDGHKGKEATS